MAGYVIVSMEITDPDMFAGYAERIVDVVEAHGGKYIVRNDSPEVTDGNWHPSRIVVMEFESLDRAREFVNSSGYQELREIRLKCTNADIVVVDGV